jgi:chemotaxis protein MotB
MMNKSPKRKTWEETPRDHGEELWIVSYADMVTLLFGFFVIMYSFSTLDDKKFSQMGEQMAAAFQAKDEAKPKKNAAASVSGEARQLRAMQLMVAMTNLGSDMDDAVSKIERAYADKKSAEGLQKVVNEQIAPTQNVRVSSVTPQASAGHEDVIELVLPSATLFSQGSHALTPGAQEQLRQVAAKLVQAADLSTIEVVGHTDQSPPSSGSSYPNNFTLSSMRAGTVAEALMRGGVDPKLLVIRGMGSLSPLLPEKDRQGAWIPANMAKNRRVHLVLKRRPDAAR